MIKIKMSESESDCREVAAGRMEMMNSHARTGDVRGLYSSIKSDPQLLKDMDKIQFIHTPLHEAAASGQPSFALEILSLMPSFGKKLNLEGLSPLHVALEHKQITTARSLVRMDKQVVRVKGMNGSTPLHFAVEKAQTKDEMEILAYFLLECPESIHDLNNRLQTAVHVALECNNSESSQLLLNWLTRTSRESILALEDMDGNTALHTAVQHDCAKEVKVLVKLVKLNTKNLSGKTPLDVAEEYSNTNKVKKILVHAKARKASQLAKVDSKGEYLQSKVTTPEDLLRGYYFTYKDFVQNLRNDIMVVAVLIATATYQAVLQPPGGVHPPDVSKLSDAVSASGSQSAVAGKMVMKWGDYRQFMPANTAAFILSTAMILLVLQGQPSNIFLLLCLIFLANSYLSALHIISNSSAVTTSMLVICWSVIGAVFFIKLLGTIVKALIDDVWWMPRLSIKVSNRIFDRPVGQRIQTSFPIVQKLTHQYQLIKR